MIFKLGLLKGFFLRCSKINIWSRVKDSLVSLNVSLKLMKWRFHAVAFPVPAMLPDAFLDSWEIFQVV